MTKSKLRHRRGVLRGAIKSVKECNAGVLACEFGMRLI